MKSEEYDWGRDFFPLVNPPEKVTASRTYCFAFRERRLLLLKDTDETFRLPSLKEAQESGIGVLRQQYLGELLEISCYSMELDGSDTGTDISSEELCFAGMRELAGILEEPLASLAGKAVHIMEWDKNTSFCGRCGSPTAQKENERAKQCPECGFLAFPKISPAIIVLIEKGDQLLLARSPHFPPDRYSVIAGFVEPGESVEQAVVREIMEEVGISVKNINYFGSQPWPYPDSLMIGFTAEFLEGDIRIDGVEIEEAGWFKKNEIPNIPGTGSISGQLIHHFINKHS